MLLFQSTFQLHELDTRMCPGESVRDERDEGREGNRRKRKGGEKEVQGGVGENTSMAARL